MIRQMSHYNHYYTRRESSSKCPYMAPISLLFTSRQRGYVHSPEPRITYEISHMTNQAARSNSSHSRNRNSAHVARASIPRIKYLALSSQLPKNLLGSPMSRRRHHRNFARNIPARQPRAQFNMRSATDNIQLIIIIRLLLVRRVSRRPTSSHTKRLARRMRQRN